MDVLCAGLVTGAVIKNLFLFYLSHNRPQKVKVGCVTGIKLYPLKSAGGVSIKEATCSRIGLQQGALKDRHWMVVGPDGVSETACGSPALNLVDCQLIGDSVQLTAPNVKPLKLPLKPSTENPKVINAVVEKEPIQAVDCGDEPACWIQTYLNKPGYRIVYANPALPKRNMKNHLKKMIREAEADGELAFAAEGPFLLVNETSMKDLNSRLEQTASIENFRGNIRVSTDTPFHEETWKDVYISDVKLNFVSLCERCMQTTIHPGVNKTDANHQPLVTLNQYRSRVGYKTGCFGVLFATEQEGSISVGDDIYATIDTTKSVPKSKDI